MNSNWVPRILTLTLFTIALFSAEAAPELNSAADYNRAIQRVWNNKKKAYILAKKGHRLFRKNAELMGRLAWCENRLKRSPYGTKLIEQAFKLEPNHRAINTWRLQIFMSAGYYEKNPRTAIKHWKKAVQIKPDLTAYYYKIGVKYFQAKDYPMAIKWLTKASARKYNLENVSFMLGLSYLSMKQGKTAIKYFKTCIKENKSNSTCIYYLAGAYGSQDNPHLWAKYLEEFLKLKPDNKATRSTLAFLAPTFKISTRQFQYLINKYPHDKSIKQWKKRLRLITPRVVEVQFEFRNKRTFKNGTLFVIPVESKYQRHIAYTILPKTTQKRVIKKAGNSFLKLNFRRPPEKVTVITRIRINPLTIAQGDTFKPIDMDDTPAKHLGLFRIHAGVDINPASPQLKRLAHKIVGNEKDVYKKAQLIQSWLSKTFTYKVVTYNSIETYLSREQAECGGYAIVFVSLARAAGIPARRMFAPIMEYKAKETLGSHAISEFYDSRYGWVPVDNTGNVIGKMFYLLQISRSEPRRNSPDATGPSEYKLTHTGDDSSMSSLRTSGSPTPASSAASLETRIIAGEKFEINKN